MSQSELLSDVVALLNAAEVPYMVVGSFASSFHGEPRMTRDIDIVVDPTPKSIDVLVDLVDRDRLYVGDARSAVRDRSMFNLIDPATGWKVDFVVRRERPFSEVEFDRRTMARVAGVDVYLATAEDTMLAKLEWAAASGSERQVADVVAIALNQDVDRTYLTRWARDLGVEEALVAALKDADALRDPR